MQSPSPSVSDQAQPPTPGRTISLDQFRGYTVWGMFVVNFVGCFTVIPAILKHHNAYYSYADGQQRGGGWWA